MAKKNIDVASFLANNATPKGKKGSDIPEVDCGELGDKVFLAYQAAQDAEAQFKALEGELLEKVRPEYEEGAQGTFSKSINVVGKATPGVQVTYRDQFCKIPADREEGFRAILGEKFDRYFFQKRDIAMVDTSDETVSLLIQKLGPEMFKKIFKIELSLGCKPDMDRNQFALPGEIREGVVQYKAAVKARKE